MPDELVSASPDALVHELSVLIDSARHRVASTVNSELVLLYWRVGLRLREEVVGDGRAAYGEQTVEVVARALTGRFGRGSSKRSLYRMIRLAEVFPDRLHYGRLNRKQASAPVRPRTVSRTAPESVAASLGCTTTVITNHGMSNLSPV